MNTPLTPAATPTPTATPAPTTVTTNTSTAFTDPGVVTNCGTKRMQVSNTGNFTGASNVNWAADAHRWYNQVTHNSSGNYAGFACETNITFGPNAGPCHGGVWSIVTANGAPGASFGAISSVFRKNGSGSAYGNHSEVWDYSTEAGLNVGYNAEFNAAPSKDDSAYIGYNVQPGVSCKKHVVGLQAQSNPGAPSDQFDAVILANCNSKVVIDARGTNGIPLAVNSALLKDKAGINYGETVPMHVHSYLPIIVDGTTLLIPLFNVK